ncbi:MAG: ABC transporter permease [Clostridium sp.]|nr:ABC transporter permease [Clostridium sp.]MCM1460162.1 ABC transporter permease [Bacteroides sp.]
MLKNNNKTAVKRISRQSLKNNRARNVFSMLAIMLTTIMFTTIFTLCFSLYENIETMFVREEGTAANIFYQHPTYEQLEAVKGLKHINAVGVQIYAGAVYIPKMEGEYIYFNYYDETEFEEHFMPAISDVEGHYPVQENELMLSASSLDALGIDKPAEGMKLAFDFFGGGSKEFVLSGWYQDYMNYSGSKGGLVSKKYIEENGIDMNVDGRICISPKKGQTDSLFEELEEVEERLNVDLQNFYYIDNRVQSQGSAISIFGVAVLLGLIIVSSGYLLIYNVMYISVSKDTRFYGLLKTIGTTPKQIKSIVRAQVMRLAIIGLPVGIIIGSGISFVVMPIAMHMFDAGNFSAMPEKIYFNPIIYVVTVLFVMVTILISCRKPAKLAGSVSPVEAAKYTGVYAGKSKKKNTTSGGKLYRMAFRNVFREKKSAVLVFASLFMGTIAFLAMNAFLRGLDLENYANLYLPYDYTINCHISNESGYDNMRKQSEALAEELKEIDGMSAVSINKKMYVLLEFNRDTYMPFLEPEANYTGSSPEELAEFYETNKNPDASYGTFAVTADDWIIEKYAAFRGEKIDIDAFVNGDICIVGCLETDEEANRMVGKTITMTSGDGSHSIDLQVASCSTYESSSFLQFAGGRYMAGCPEYIVLSHKAMERLGADYTVDSITMTCEADKEAYVTNDVKRLTENRDNVATVEIKTESMNSLATAIKTMNLLTNGISILLILIGVINFINVMMTGVYARRKEFALLESVGMTQGQVKKMLMLEGGYYGIISIGLIATLGNGIIYIVSTLTEKAIDYAAAVYPFAELLIICVLIIAVCIIVPSVLYKSMAGETLTDRLREE